MTSSEAARSSFRRSALAMIAATAHARSPNPKLLESSSTTVQVHLSAALEAMVLVAAAILGGFGGGGPPFQLLRRPRTDSSGSRSSLRFKP
jgi:hypothetical protein